jgi:hypothetical protein
MDRAVSRNKKNFCTALLEKSGKGTGLLFGARSSVGVAHAIPTRPEEEVAWGRWKKGIEPNEREAPRRTEPLLPFPSFPVPRALPRPPRRTPSPDPAAPPKTHPPLASLPPLAALGPS